MGKKSAKRYPLVQESVDEDCLVMPEAYSLISQGVTKHKRTVHVGDSFELFDGR